MATGRKMTGLSPRGCLSQMLNHIGPAFSVIVPSSLKVKSNAAGMLWVSRVCVHVKWTNNSGFERSSCLVIIYVAPEILGWDGGRKTSAILLALVACYF